MTGFFILAMLLSFVGMYFSSKLKSKFAKYSRLGMRSGLSGYEVAQQMLSHYGIHDVQVVEGKGFLTDHYNPRTKTVSLSPQVFRGRHIAAAAVAAHECGHAVQHATAYNMLQMRSALVPVVQVAASFQQWLLLAAFMLLSTIPQLMLIAIGAFAVTTLFSLITLPVEFDASKRAIVWLDQSGVAVGEENIMARDALTWAGMTYVVAALTSLIMLLYLILRFTNR